MTTEESDPPEPGDTEISIFGPGIGECIVIHLGCGMWMVVDSCIDRASGRAVALDYLDSLGVKVATQVKYLVVTHFHDDHILGASAVLEAAKAATFCCSDAFKHHEMKRALAASIEPHLKPSGIDELRELFEIVRRRGTGRQASRGPMWLKAVSVVHADRSCEVHALSPSDGAITLGFTELAEYLPEAGQTRRRVVAPEPNVRSVVLWVRSGENRILLGADLPQVDRDANVGWSAVVSDNRRPGGSAGVFKVAHHGSKNAHHEPVWEHMLASEPLAVLTPYTRSHLPTLADLERVLRTTPRVFCTAPSKGQKLSRSAPVDRMVRGTTTELRTASGAMGHVRLRAAMHGEGEWRVERFGRAFQVRA